MHCGRLMQLFWRSHTAGLSRVDGLSSKNFWSAAQALSSMSRQSSIGAQSPLASSCGGSEVWPGETMTEDPILVTGAAGFIGFHVALRLLENRRVVGLDSLNDYYDPKLKQARLDVLRCQTNFSFVKVDLANRETTKSLFAEHRFPVVINLAAQAGVRY